MSLYSELMGSFIRTGNYPLEADYIFATEEELKEYYSDPLNATLLHKGWLKVVENDGEGNQALYWVVIDEDTDELTFTKLITSASFSDISDWMASLEEMLNELEEKLNLEIEDRKTADTAIWGTSDKTNLPDDLNSLLDLANAVQELQELIKSNSENIDTLRKQLMTTVGTENSDIITYLLTLPYLSLTEISNLLNKFLNELDSSTSKINTLPELQNFLEGYTDSDTLNQVLEDLINCIYGSPLPSEDFRTLRGIEDFVRTLKLWSENRTDNLLTELDQTQVGIGLSSDGSYSADQETYYLQDATSVMNALKILDSLVYEALQGITINVDNSDVVELAVRKDSEGYTIGAKLNLSNVYGNQILKKSDGIYMSVSSEYDDGILTLKVNDNVISQHILGFSNLVDSAYYDSSNELIVIVFKLLSGENQTINIPVGALIREWEPDNTNSDRVVELYREVVIDGADKVSADVRIAEDNTNILEKQGNTLIVRGTSDNLTHNGLTLESFLESFESASEELEDIVNGHISDKNNPHEVTAEQVGLGNVDNTSDLDKPISTATQEALNEKAPIYSPILQGVPLVEESPDLNDSSQRIPSTNWVNLRISEEISNITIQTDSYTKTEVDNLLNNKADLVDGKVPEDLLPECKLLWNEV